MMDPNKAIQFGQLVQSTYDIPPASLVNDAGKYIGSAYDPFGKRYRIITTIYGSDLATDMNPDRGNQTVSFGYVLQDSSNDVVIAIRGTEGIWEWIHDAEFLYVPCPFLPEAGLTEDGFTAIYRSLRIGEATSAPPVTAGLASLPFEQPVGSLTICGHSLGGALATLLSIDVAANSGINGFKNPSSYTYGSPRVGDPKFAVAYDRLVSGTFRIANRVDIVPKLPMPPMYEHVAGLLDLNPITLGPPPKELVKFTPACEHNLMSYIHLLSLLPGVTLKLPQCLDPVCDPGQILSQPAL